MRRVVAWLRERVSFVLGLLSALNHTLSEER